MCMVRSELQAALRRSDRPLAHTRATATLLSLGCMHLAARTIIRYRPGGPFENGELHRSKSRVRWYVS